MYKIWKCIGIKRFSSTSFINQIKEGNDLTVTDPTMTRFVMTLEEAVDLVLFAFENGESGDIFVQKHQLVLLKY